MCRLAQDLFFPGVFVTVVVELLYQHWGRDPSSAPPSNSLGFWGTCEAREYVSLPLSARRAPLRQPLAVLACAIQGGSRDPAWIQRCHLTAESPEIHCSTGLRQHTSTCSQPQPNTHVVIVVTLLGLTENVRHASDIPRRDNTLAVNLTVEHTRQHATTNLR